MNNLEQSTFKLKSYSYQMNLWRLTQDFTKHFIEKFDKSLPKQTAEKSQELLNIHYFIGIFAIS